MASDLEGFAPCPTCKQYHPSITLRGDPLDAFMRLTAMDAHPVRGHPMGYRHSDEVRDAAAKFASALEAQAADLRTASDIVAEQTGQIINLRATIERLQAERDAAVIDRDRLREALIPFAAYRASDQYLASNAEDDGLCAAVSFRAGDYRRAKAALATESPSRDGGE